MLPVHLALVSKAQAIGLGELLVVSAAIQKQLTRDFGPIWNVEATIDEFLSLEDLPVDYWPIFVVDTFERGGQHRDRNNQPYALVAAAANWSVVASHEALEMLADPSGNRLVAGASPMPGQGRVSFLVEVCDPCQLEENAYTVNGVFVSDFYTPNYFDPMASTGVRYSFSGAVTAPRQVLPGGYLSWLEPSSGDWFQENRFAAHPEFKNFGPIKPLSGSIRAAVNQLTPRENLALHPADLEYSSRHSAARASARTASIARAAMLEACIREAHRRD